MGLRVRVDAERCCASGMCALTAPEVFDQDERVGTVVLLAPAPPKEAWADVRAAEDGCPAGAITVDED